VRHHTPCNRMINTRRADAQDTLTRKHSHHPRTSNITRTNAKSHAAATQMQRRVTFSYSNPNHCTHQIINTPIHNTKNTFFFLIRRENNTSSKRRHKTHTHLYTTPHADAHARTIFSIPVPHCQQAALRFVTESADPTRTAVRRRLK